MTGAMQARLNLVALKGGIARFGMASAAHSVAMLDVVGAEAALASAGDATQEELLAGRAQFLNTQTSPFQVFVRAEPVDLGGILGRRSKEALRGSRGGVDRARPPLVCSK